MRSAGLIDVVPSVLSVDPPAKNGTNGDINNNNKLFFSRTSALHDNVRTDVKKYFYIFEKKVEPSINDSMP